MDVISKRIVTNGKRLAKLSGLCVRERKEQVAKYVIAECRALKIKLDACTMRRMVVCISDRVHKMEVNA